jgi:AraC-like DNA-binding protein
MLSNYHKSITLHDMAFVANLSTSAFCRYFKRITNKTFIQFLNEIRIGQACKILQEKENYSISQICYECGFNNVSYFINCFKKNTGMTPLEYRSGAINEPLAVDC